MLIETMFGNERCRSGTFPLGTQRPNRPQAEAIRIDLEPIAVSSAEDQDGNGSEKDGATHGESSNIETTLVCGADGKEEGIPRKPKLHRYRYGSLAGWKRPPRRKHGISSTESGGSLIFAPPNDDNYCDAVNYHCNRQSSLDAALRGNIIMCSKVDFYEPQFVKSNPKSISRRIDGEKTVGLISKDTDAEAASPTNSRSGSVQFQRNGSQRRQGSKREPRRKGPLLPQRSRASRLVGKKGDHCIKEYNLEGRFQQFLKDFYNTLLDITWSWTFFIVVSTYFASWIFYALFYYTVCFAHGDFEYQNLASNSTFEPCIKNAHSFMAMFLLSVETQGTIGYGYRYVTEQCVAVVLGASIQSLSGVIIEAFLVAIVITKLSRPKKRAQTLIFSHNAVISLRDGKLCFMIRIGDMRTSHLIDAHLRLMLVKSYKTQENEELPFQRFDMTVGFHKNHEDNIFLAWPSIVCHVIDEDSPLYEYSAQSLEEEDFEIIAILEGIIETTGNTTQARTSYKPNEILWGHRFDPCFTYPSKGEHRVDYARFHKSFPVEMPACSARSLLERLDSNTASVEV